MPPHDVVKEARARVGQTLLVESHTRGAALWHVTVAGNKTVDLPRLNRIFQGRKTLATTTYPTASYGGGSLEGAITPAASRPSVS
jgi:hypothetical protein